MNCQMMIMVCAILFYSHSQLSQKALNKHTSDDTSSMASASISCSQVEGGDDGGEYFVPFRIFFSLSLLASISAASRRAFASGSSSLMNLSGEGHTMGSADEGFSSAAHAS